MLDLHTLHKGLEAGTQLAGSGVDVLLLDGADGQAEVTLQDEGVDHALVAPVLAELVGGQDHAVGMVLLSQVSDPLLAGAHLILGHEARAVGGLQVVLGDAAQRALAFLQHDGHAALHSAVAEAVADHQGAAALDELGEVGVIVLGAGQNHLAAEVLLVVGLAGLHLLGSLPQVGQNQFLGADQAHQLDHMELIAGDGGVIQLAVVADLVDEAADLVVLLDGLDQRFVGNVDAEVLMQGLQNVGAQLSLVVLIADLVVFEGDVGKLAEEVVVVDDAHILDGVEMLLLQVLLEAAGGRAGLGAHLGVKEVVAALERALQQRAGVVADTAGEVVGRDVGGSAARRSQSDGEAAGQVEKYFRHEVAGVADCALAFGFRLFDKVVVGFLKQILKVDQMFEISHR